MTTYIDLQKYYNTNGGKLFVYAIDCPAEKKAKWRRPAVIIVPGGGYEHVSKREGAPVACKFLASGFQGFVLEYLTATDGAYYPEQLHELAASVDYLKKHADEYGLSKDEIFVVGFSAGGHLVANLATAWHNAYEILGEKLDCAPTAIGLGYPVISAELGHTRSHDNLLKGYPQAQRTELCRKLNLDNAITKYTPPAFIWTTAVDACVHAQNSLQFALSLAKIGVRYELHIYPEGEHGEGACDCEVNKESAHLKKNAQWLNCCAEFFRLFTREKY